MSVRCPQTNLQIRIIKKKSLRGRKDFQCRYVYQYHILMILFSFVSGIANCYAQIGKFDKDSLMNRFVYQLGVFPQEKVYLHTDKGTYMAGDTLWFRSYIVDATLH